MNDNLFQIPVEKVTLGNGLEVILHRDAGIPLVAVNVWYHVGSKNERPGRSGFAHLFEHMMFQGSAHQDQEYFGPLQEVGAQLNGSTSTDRTNYWEVATANHLERLLLMEADRMGWLIPAMTQEKLDNQRDVVRNERRQSEGAPYSVFRLEFNRLLYPVGHPYDHSVIGEHEDLEAATLEDVQDFFRTFYIPNNASLCIAGNFDRDQALQWVEQYFGEIPPGDPVEEISVWVPRLSGEKRVRLKDRVQLTRLHQVWHSPPAFHGGDADLDLAAQILGSGRTSRLYRLLVHERKLAQDVSAWQAGGQLASTFQIHTTLKPDADPGEVEALVDGEVRRLRHEGPRKEELQRVVNSYEAAFVKALQRVGSFGGKSDLLNSYNHYVGTPDYLHQDMARYLKATPESVQAALQVWLGEDRMMVEVGPAGEPAAATPGSVDRSTLPAGSSPPELSLPKVEESRLSMGLRVQTAAKPSLPLARVELVFMSGVKDDAPETSGLAMLATDMLLSGTQSRDKFAFAEALEELGTDMSTSTGSDYSGLSLVCLSKHLEASVSLLREALLTPAYAEAELEHERARRILNIERERENPWRLASRVTRRVVFGDNHPYGRMASGTVESLQALTRDDLAAFSGRHFTPRNGVCLAVGDCRHSGIVDVVQEGLADWAAPPAGDAKPEAVPPGELDARTVFLVHKPGDSQATVALAHSGIARSDSRWEAVYLANRVLGGMFISRLNLNLREDKGYTYGAFSRFSQSVHPGLFSMGGRVEADVTAPAVSECLKELTEIREARPITSEELEFARNAVIREYPAEFETLSEIADALAEQAIYGLPDDYAQEYPARINAVTLEQVREAAVQVFHPQHAAVVVIGDLDVIRKPLEELAIGPVRELSLSEIGLPEA